MSTQRAGLERAREDREELGRLAAKEGFKLRKLPEPKDLLTMMGQSLGTYYAIKRASQPRASSRSSASGNGGSWR